ncbi:MAG: peptidoglycan DD-metalloendopeptidase family protein [Balneolaceae bacterium]|nr:peptidoglycan DD-metalloendopeptidase family protein [Balneolaceae bacterium]
MSRSLPFDPTEYKFAPIIKYDGEWRVFDFTKGYDPGKIREITWGIGRYDEKRLGMYVAPHYKNSRNIHIGIDFWTPAEEPVYVFYDGEVAYFRDNSREGDYGPTIITKHHLNGTSLFALHGHLSRESLAGLEEGQPVKKGQQIAMVGTKDENGGWEPHLHFQLSVEDPGQADMPGVVARKIAKQHLKNTLIRV